MAGLLASRIGASLHLIGSEGLLLTPERELVRLNTAAAFLWTCVEDGLARDEAERLYADAFGRSPSAARHEVVAVLADWDRMGLLATSSPRLPVEAPAAAAPVPCTPPAAAVTDTVRILDRVYRLRFATPELAQLVMPVLAHLRVERAAAGADLDVFEGEEGFVIGIDGQIAETCREASEVAPQAKSALLVDAINRVGFAAYFHAASLRVGDRLLLLPAAAGSGKTTLSLALADAGFHYHGDESALLLRPDMHVRSVPLSLCIKDSAWPLIGTTRPELAGIAAHDRIDGKRVKYLPPPVVPGDPALDRAWPVRWIVFPRYGAGLATRITPLEGADALHRLLRECNAWQLPLTPAAVDELVAWVGGITSFELEYGSSAAAVAGVRQICETAP